MFANIQILNAFLKGKKYAGLVVVPPRHHEESAVYSIMSATVKDSIKTFSTEPSQLIYYTLKHTHKKSKYQKVVKRVARNEYFGALLYQTNFENRHIIINPFQLFSFDIARDHQNEFCKFPHCYRGFASM